MSVPERWSAVPSPDPDEGARGSVRGHDPVRPVSAGPVDGLEARPASSTTADGRVHGRPAPQYGEYAPEGWVNPVLVEQERREREEAARARRLEAAQEAAATNRTPHGPQRPSTTGSVPPGRGPVRAPHGAGAQQQPARLGASPGDLLLTVVLLAFGLVSVVQSLSVGQVASTVARTLEQRYTPLSDPQSLIPAALISAIGSIVILVLVAWWSVVRLRRGKRTFWVPLLGGVAASLLSTICFTVVVMQDGPFVSWVLQHGGA